MIESSRARQRPTGSAMPSSGSPLLTTILAVCHVTGNFRNFPTEASQQGGPAENLRCRLQPNLQHILLCSSCYLFRNGAAIYRCQAALNFSAASSNVWEGIEETDTWFEAELETSGSCITCYLACRPHSLFVRVSPEQQRQTSSPLDRRRRQAEEAGRKFGRLIETNGPWERSLVVLRVISCITASFLIGMSVVIYLCCGMFYQDCLAHMCSEVALVAAYICLLAVTTDTLNITQMVCSLTAMGLQYFFQVAFLSLMLEAYFINRMLCTCFGPRHILSSPILLLLIAWGLPAIITGISAAALFDEYSVDIDVCWVNLGSNVKWTVVIPIVIFSSLQLVMLSSVFVTCQVPHHVSFYDFNRARSYLSTRWAALFVHLGTVVVWSTGFLAEYTQRNNMHVVFCVFSILLGAFLPVVRVATEEQVRIRIWLRLVPDPEHRLPWPITSFDEYDDVKPDMSWTSPVEKFSSESSLKSKF